MVSTIVTILYIRSSDLIYLRTKSLYPFTNFSPFSPLPSLGNHHSTLLLWVRLFKKIDTMQYLSFSVWLISISTFTNYFPCMAESLSCSLETITTLLIGGSPIQNKKFKKNPHTKPKKKKPNLFPSSLAATQACN